ncbi:hypothetical protein [Chondromyces apiculatus]|uniref:Uncharacterized protein n=1 Tax=Chondromyces apiculatus DSM 436 TaxID=1192034 RepID=A0A017SZC5_9BACT|nr:hypothetical protein [Chondromyces apiculatus]EYF02328.1 Hypothetical protein CAP_7257 [Chondromyces apiculatus DSM 436]
MAVLGATGAFGCLQRPVEPVEPRTTSTIIERINQSGVDKIDILLAIDNSQSMADKQAILALAVPDLIKGLVNPPCINPDNPSDQQSVATPTTDCPEGYEREFEPVLDVHIGIISSSIGGYGGDACTESGSASNNDKGRLLARSSADAGSDLVENTYQGKGFLAWDPDQKKDTGATAKPGVADPGDGEADLDADSELDLNATALIPVLTDMVIGVGQEGCGYEAALESWYRFLVDPEPSTSLVKEGTNIVPQGLDQDLLKQRADFLRPDSLLAIILLSDENDCSIREGSQYYLAATYGNNYHLPRARTECATDPNNECCFSCAQTKEGCEPDPNCFASGSSNPLPVAAEQDHPNLRCFDQKRRFGIDFLYPMSRYTNALKNQQVPNRKGELVPNPIFSDLTGGVGNIRDAGLVFFAGIVGVPWQDIARNPGNLSEGFKTAEELSAPVGSLGSTWEAILGDPDKFIQPADPFMRESVIPRDGTNPITGDAIVVTDAATAQQESVYNAINGTEWKPNVANSDLQFACIFKLPEPVDCSTNAPGCDCAKSPDIPLCSGVTQNYAKAYPGLRELQLIKSVGSQGIVGSVCPAQLSNNQGSDFGYRPAIGAIIDRLKQVLGGQCLPRSLVPNKEKQVSCLIIEARNSQGQCSCDEATGRGPISDVNRQAESEIRNDPSAQASGWDCFCEIKQLAKEPLEACQNTVGDDVQDPQGNKVNGWCYIDGTTSPPLGAPELVASCAQTQRRLIRFVGDADSAAGATTFITCAGEPGTAGGD